MSAGAHQADEARRRRLRWRARRGLLENDLVMARVFDRFEASLTDADELLDLILGRRELEGEAATPSAQRVLGMLRSV